MIRFVEFRRTDRQEREISKKILLQETIGTNYGVCTSHRRLYSAIEKRIKF
jgi:hypothetical protein